MTKSLSLFDHETPRLSRDEEGALYTPYVPQTVAKDSYDAEWWESFQSSYKGTYTAKAYVPKPPMTSDTDPMRADMFTAKQTKTKGRLGMTFAPGKYQKYGLAGDHDRDLGKDLDRLYHEYGCTVLIPLVEDSELKALKIEDIFDALEERKMGWIWYAYRDMTAPLSLSDTFDLVTKIVTYMQEGHNVVIHCKGGLGRTGTIAACVLLFQGYSAKDAIELTRKVRKGTIQNGEQINFVYYFAEYVAAKR